MDQWDGSYQELKDFIATTNVVGEWRDLGNGQFQFRSRAGGILNWWSSRGTIIFQGPEKHKAALMEAVAAASAGQVAESPAVPGRSTTVMPAKRRVFVVHGHDTATREQLEWLLMKLDLEPYVLQNRSGLGKTIIEALEQQIGKTPEAEFGIVLMTPDDLGRAKSEAETDLHPRARQNVILEMGMLLSSLTRERVAILMKGHVEKPTDIDGILYIAFNEHVKETLPKLAQHLKQCGFEIDTSKVS